MRFTLTRRRLIQATPAAAAAITTPALITPFSAHAQDGPTAAPLVVDDTRTANPDLVPTDLQIPDGFDVAPQTVNLPEGFAISVLAAGLDSPRFMAVDAAGNLLVADPNSGNIYRFPAADGAIAPAPAPPDPLLSGLTAPSNVALFDDGGTTYLYIGETNQISRVVYDPAGEPGEPEVVVPDLPNGGNHRTRTVAFGPDSLLYVGIGSSCNICEEEDDRRAAVMRYTPTGEDETRFAWGLRNPVGLAFQPGTGRLWATVNERDDQGDEIPPDLVTVVQDGANYGWPACQPPNATPQEEGTDCSGITPPTVGIQAHSAPLGLAFAIADPFPPDFAGLFVAQHGSWNRSDPAAPKLLRIAFDGDAPSAAADFATGWQDDSGDRWGRPAGILLAPDGALIVSDDTAGLLYRIAYEA